MTGKSVFALLAIFVVMCLFGTTQARETRINEAKLKVDSNFIATHDRVSADVEAMMLRAFAKAAVNVAGTRASTFSSSTAATGLYRAMSTSAFNPIVTGNPVQFAEAMQSQAGVELAPGVPVSGVMSALSSVHGNNASPLVQDILSNVDVQRLVATAVSATGGQVVAPAQAALDSTIDALDTFGKIQVKAVEAAKVVGSKLSEIDDSAADGQLKRGLEGIKDSIAAKVDAQAISEKAVEFAQGAAKIAADTAEGLTKFDDEKLGGTVKVALNAYLSPYMTPILTAREGYLALQEVTGFDRKQVWAYWKETGKVRLVDKDGKLIVLTPEIAAKAAVLAMKKTASNLCGFPGSKAICMSEKRLVAYLTKTFTEMIQKSQAIEPAGIPKLIKDFREAQHRRTMKALMVTTKKFRTESDKKTDGPIPTTYANVNKQTDEDKKKKQRAAINKLRAKLHIKGNPIIAKRGKTPAKKAVSVASKFNSLAKQLKAMKAIDATKAAAATPAVAPVTPVAAPVAPDTPTPPKF